MVSNFIEDDGRLPYWRVEVVCKGCKIGQKTPTRLTSDFVNVYQDIKGLNMNTIPDYLSRYLTNQLGTYVTHDRAEAAKTFGLYVQPIRVTCKFVTRVSPIWIGELKEEALRYLSCEVAEYPFNPKIDTICNHRWFNMYLTSEISPFELKQRWYESTIKLLMQMGYKELYKYEDFC